jgi:hypothetical protein
MISKKMPLIVVGLWKMPSINNAFQKNARLLKIYFKKAINICFQKNALHNGCLRNLSNKRLSEKMPSIENVFRTKCP